MGTMWGRVAAWAWRQRTNAGALMILYVALGIPTIPLAALDPAAGRTNLPGLAIAAFLAWRICRGGGLSRLLLIFLTGLGYLATVLDVARAWNAPVLALLVINGAQFVLVLSPPVYRRTHKERPGRPGRPLAWPVPPAWLLLGGAAAGFIITLCFLGSMNFQPVPGCGPHGATMAHLPDRCFTLAEGYPLRFLSADQNIPEINKPAMARDWAQWSLLSGSVLYLAYGSHLSAPAKARTQVPEDAQALG